MDLDGQLGLADAANVPLPSSAPSSRPSTVCIPLDLFQLGPFTHSRSRRSYSIIYLSVLLLSLAPVLGFGPEF
jgi:hypothetical protein